MFLSKQGLITISRVYVRWFQQKGSWLLVFSDKDSVTRLLPPNSRKRALRCFQSFCECAWIASIMLFRIMVWDVHPIIYLHPTTEEKVRLPPRNAFVLPKSLVRWEARPRFRFQTKHMSWCFSQSKASLLYQQSLRSMFSTERILAFGFPWLDSVTRLLLPNSRKRALRCFQSFGECKAVARGAAGAARAAPLFQLFFFFFFVGSLKQRKRRKIDVMIHSSQQRVSLNKGSMIAFIAIVLCRSAAAMPWLG